VELVYEEETLKILGIPGLPYLELSPTENGTFETAIGEMRFHEAGGVTFLFLGRGAIGERVVLRPAVEGFADFWAGTWEVFRGAEELHGIMMEIGVTERGYAYASMLGIQLLFSSIDLYTSYSPGRMRNTGSVSEAIWDGEQYLMRESNMFMRRAERSVLRFVSGQSTYTRNGEATPLQRPTHTYEGRIWLYVHDASEIFGIPAANMMPLTEEFGGRPYIQLRVISEALGGVVEWNSATRAAYVTV
jgi:hypothetical protein